MLLRLCRKDLIKASCEKPAAVLFTCYHGSSYLCDTYEQWRLKEVNAGGFPHVDTGTLQGIGTSILQGIDTGNLYTAGEMFRKILVKILGTQAWLVGSLLLHCRLGCSQNS